MATPPLQVRRTKTNERNPSRTNLRPQNRRAEWLAFRFCSFYFAAERLWKPFDYSEMHLEFGIFEPVFESAHGYLALLNLSPADATEAVESVRNCCGTVSNPFSDICRLLTEVNWRPHLVAAVAVIVSGYDAEAVRLLWHRLDCGSWVTPQIAAALFLVDPDFHSQARARLEARCLVDSTELRSMSPIERHSATGPAGSVPRSAKTAAALLQLAAMISPIPVWLQEMRAARDMQALVAQDMDGSEEIAERWLNRIKEITGKTI